MEISAIQIISMNKKLWPVYRELDILTYDTAADDNDVKTYYKSLMTLIEKGTDKKTFLDKAREAFSKLHGTKTLTIKGE